jgi:hypothetical protein
MLCCTDRAAQRFFQIMSCFSNSCATAATSVFFLVFQSVSELLLCFVLASLEVICVSETVQELLNSPFGSRTLAMAGQKES